MTSNRHDFEQNARTGRELGFHWWQNWPQTPKTGGENPHPRSVWHFPGVFLEKRQIVALRLNCIELIHISSADGSLKSTSKKAISRLSAPQVTERNRRIPVNFLRKCEFSDGAADD
jgi:hypothetical protein